MKEKTIAIAGNPNTGKTTIFNALTGLRQKTGNWPGVTVEIKEGYFVYKNVKFRVIDLPGTYSLTSYTEDEKIARDFLVKENIDAVVVVVDASNLERNLYLVSLLSELQQNIVVDLNMIDIAESNGIKIDTEKLEKILGIPFVKTIGNRNYGIENLKESILKSVEKKKTEFFKINYGEEIEKTIEEIEKIIGNLSSPYPSRFFAIRLLERDEEFTEKIRKNKEIYKKICEIIEKKEKKVKNLEEYIIEKRYGFIHGLVKECISRINIIEAKIELTNKLDTIFTNRFLGLPIFLFFMWITFQIVFKWGAPFSQLLGRFFSFIGEKFASLLLFLNFPNWFISLIKDGIIAGVGSIIVFLPNIFLLFFIFSALEDSGYMARAAFVTDRIMHKIGLHGKSAIPLILGFGCNVPAIMATRTLETKKDRILTILTIPFMSCSARLPVYLLFTGIFFKKYQGTILFSLYLVGIIIGILSAKFFKSLFFREQTIPLIMELPPYHIPLLKNMFISAWERSYLFLRKAGTIIFSGVVLVWVLSHFPFSVEFAGKESIIGKIGSFLAPALKPAGFGFWQASVALLFGLIAKELVVGTFGTLFGGEEQLPHVLSKFFSPIAAYSFMLMSLLYMPCIATIAVIKQEAGGKWAFLSTLWSIFVGWSFAVIFYQIASIWR